MTTYVDSNGTRYVFEQPKEGWATLKVYHDDICISEMVVPEYAVDALTEELERECKNYERLN